MRKLLALAFLALSVASANAQYLNISPQGLTAGSTPVSGCTSLQLFYNNAGLLGCMAGTSWDNTNGFLGLGITTSPQAVFELQGTPYISDSALPSLIAMRSNVAYNSSPRTGINFGNKYTSGGAVAGMGGILVGKENATDGNLAGYLALFTRPAAGSVTERFRITSDARVQIKGELESSALKPTAAGAGGTCATGAIAGGANAGTVTLTGACAATDTLTLTFSPAVATGWSCFANDRTSATTLLAESSTSTTTAVFTFSGVASGATDVIQFLCIAY